MGVKNASKSVKFVREKQFTPVKKIKNRVKNGVHVQIGGSRPKKKTLLTMVKSKKTYLKKRGFSLPLKKKYWKREQQITSTQKNDRGQNPKGETVFF